MLKRGTMRPVKKVLGVLLMVYGLSLFIPVMAPLFAGVMLTVVGLASMVAGYFLFISGRRMN